jgi:hypothetical protein
MFSHGSPDAIAARQWGLVTRPQVLNVVSTRECKRHVASGLFVPVQRGVYRMAGAPLSWRQRAMASTLAYGPPCAVSHRAAARLLGLAGVNADDPEVTVPRWRDGRRAEIITHRAPLPEADVTERHHVPVTTPERTLVDLAAVLSPYLVERLVDDATRRGLTTPKALAALEVARCGHASRGAAALREIVAFRLEHPGIGDSEWADRIFGWIVDSCLGEPQRQVQVLVRERVMILDMAFPDRMIAIEFDGYEHHGSRYRFDRDRNRYTELNLAGWLVVQITSKTSRAEVLDKVARALLLRPPGYTQRSVA